MVDYEVIFAVRDDVFSHYKGDSEVRYPSYRIRRETIQADDENKALELARNIKSRSIDDCFTKAKILSVSDKKGLEPPKYDAF